MVVRPTLWVAFVILQPVVSGNTSARSIVVANCDPGDIVGDAVFVSANKVGGLYTVTKVNIDATIGTPNQAVSIGIIISKSDPSICKVQTRGIVAGLYSGLTPGARLFVDATSQLSAGPPARPSTGKRVVQELAYALASDTILINPSIPLRIRAA